MLLYINHKQVKHSNAIKTQTLNAVTVNILSAKQHETKQHCGSQSLINNAVKFMQVLSTKRN